MSGSARYLGALRSLQDMFVNYPMRAEMSSINIAMDSVGNLSVMVLLRASDPVILAAGIVEWKRSLTKGSSWVWRTPCGEEIYVSTTGYAPECDEIPVVVMAGPISADCYLDHDLDPDEPEELSVDTLYRWLGDEIANNWPFMPAVNNRQAAPEMSTRNTHMEPIT